MTNDKCKQVMLDIGKERNLSINPMKGIVGQYYTICRAEDLRQMCNTILLSRIK